MVQHHRSPGKWYVANEFQSKLRRFFDHPRLVDRLNLDQTHPFWFDGIRQRIYHLGVAASVETICSDTSPWQRRPLCGYPAKSRNFSATLKPGSRDPGAAVNGDCPIGII